MKHLFIISSFFTLTLTACKKDKDALAKPKYRISKITNELSQAVTITYDARGRYQTINNQIDNITISNVYDGSTIVSSFTNKSSGKTERKNTYNINSNGMAVSARTDYYDQFGVVTSSISSVREYDGTKLLKLIAPNLTATYVWNDGNLISETGGTTIVVTYDYYTDKPWQQGDVLGMGSVMQLGIDITMVIKNKNLMKGNGAVQYSYDFDAQGRISIVKLNGEPWYWLEYEEI